MIDDCLNSFIWIVLEKEPFCDVELKDGFYILENHLRK